MNISVNNILIKMENELQAAKREGSTTKLKEHLVVIRALCDLVMEENSFEKEALGKMTSPNIVTPTSFSTTSNTKLEEEDANGDSLFDF